MNQLYDHMNDLIGGIDCLFSYLERGEQNDNNLTLSVIHLFLFLRVLWIYELTPLQVAQCRLSSTIPCRTPFVTYI